MAKVADVKVSWKRSPDDKVSTQVLHLDNNGTKRNQTYRDATRTPGWGYSAQALVK